MAVNDNSVWEWPEPIQPVQILAESGLETVPAQYICPESDRPEAGGNPVEVRDVPIIDFDGLREGAREEVRQRTMEELERACMDWGFFHLVNHPLPLSLLKHAKSVAQQFFHLAAHEKQAYSNNPQTYEGYGSRLGVEKGSILDWGDYFYLNVLPLSTRNISKWPSNPTLWRETMEEYSKEIIDLSRCLLECISTNMHLPKDSLMQAFGGEEGLSLSLRVNFYPPCPQPDVTLGLSSHSDPGGLTILLQDDHVPGLQVRYQGHWVSVKPIPNAFVVNLADQLEILSNGKYKSVEHRVVVNQHVSRISIASFCNPSNNILMKPLVQEDKFDENTMHSNGRLAATTCYKAMTFGEYRSFIRRKGTKGKHHIECLKSL